MTVANRTTLEADIKAIVDEAVEDMKQDVTDATKEVSELPAAEHGKTSDQQGNKPAEPGKPAKP